MVSAPEREDLNRHHIFINIGHVDKRKCEMSADVSVEVNKERREVSVECGSDGFTTGSEGRRRRRPSCCIERFHSCYIAIYIYTIYIIYSI